MLKKLLIKNIALIDSAEINFTDGLNVLSGETGAGKSVIIESLNFVLGAKADKTLIRSGENECFVKAEFELEENSAVFDLYDQLDFDKEDVLIISRKFNLDGKSSIKVNGNTATVGMLRQFTSLLVDVHGQSEHFNLLKSSNQLELIDNFGGEQVELLKSNLRDQFADYRAVLSELDDLGGSESDRLIKTDILNYQINEIESAEIGENEEQTLIANRDKLRHQQKIITALCTLKNAFNEEGGVSDILSNISRSLTTISSLGKEYGDISERIDAVFAEIDDLASVANDLLDDLDAFELNADEIEARLDKIKSLKSKYGNSYQEIMSFLENAKNEKEKYENFTENASKLTIKKEQLQKNIYSLYNKLSQKRKIVADNFASNIITELTELGMPKASFVVEFSNFPQLDDCKFESINGADQIEFMFSANNGEPLKSMAQVISGGEMSRFMLAIKAQTAKYNDVSTFIFDEIDAGISGNVAKVVGKKFAKISLNKQIIAISHLPQICAMADNNLLISKSEDGDKAITCVSQLDNEQKTNEIVRLVGGDLDSENAIAHAKELINQAKEYKNTIKNIY